MASEWRTNSGIRVTGVHMSSAGNLNRNFWVWIDGPSVGEDWGQWRLLDDSEMSDEDRRDMTAILLHAKTNQRPVWIEDEVFLGGPTGRIKGAYIW